MTTFGYGRPPGGGGCTFTGLTANTSVRLYGFEANSGDWRITLGGVVYKVDFDTTGSPEWKTISAPYPVSVDSFTNNSFGRAYAIEVDGELLVDGGSFGENGFYLPFDPAAEGLVGQKWSDDASSTGTDQYGQKENAFNGIVDQSSASQWGGGVGETIKFENYPAGTYKVRIWTAHDATGAGDVYTLNSAGQAINKIDIEDQIPNTGTWGWVDFGSVADFTGIEIDGGSVGPGLGAIEVDGRILIDNKSYNSIGTDASGQDNHFADENFELTGSTQDTVLDTPMNNYAVLEDGASNGNLVLDKGIISNKRAVLPIPGSGKVYFEYAPERGSPTGYVLGIGEDSEDPTGNTVIGVSKTGEGYLGDGTTTPGLFSDIAVGDVLGVLIDVDVDEVKLSKNGVVESETLTLSNLSNPYPYVHVNNAAVACNFGQQPFVYDPPAGYTGLFQTWKQWARTALGYALDRIASLEQQRASDLETIAELRTQVESALARIGSIESDEVNDDAVDTVLLATVADLITRVEALETE